MANELKHHRIQWFEDFAFNLEKLTVFTIVFLPKYSLFCVPSFLLSTIIYRFCYGLHLQHGLKPSDREYYEDVFWVERAAMFFFVTSEYHSWGWFLWTLALAFYAFSNAIDLSNRGNLSLKALTTTNTTNPTPSLEQGYIFWFERVAVIVLAALPLDNFALSLFFFPNLVFIMLMTDVMSYIFYQIRTLSLNSKVDAKESGDKIETNKEDERLSKIFSLAHNHLFCFERVVLFCSILFAVRRELPLVVSTVFRILISLAHHEVNPRPIDPDFLFWIERAAMIFLLDYGSDESAYKWYIAASLFALTNTIYFINPIQDFFRILGSFLEGCKFFEGFENDLFDDKEDKEEEKEEEKSETLKVEIKTLKSENDRLKKRNQELKVEINRKLETLKVEVKRVVSENDELKVENKRLRSENDDLQKEKSSWNQELEDEIKRLRSENDDLKKDKSSWNRELEGEVKRLRSENEDLKRERSVRDEELKRVGLENEENEKLMKAREETWDERLDKAFLEKAELTAKLEEALREAEAISKDANFLASVSDRDLTVLYSLQEDGVQRAAQMRALMAMLGVARDALEHSRAAVVERETVIAAEREEYRRCRDQLLTAEGDALELLREIDVEREVSGKLSEEIQKLEERCELYRKLLHDKDNKGSSPTTSEGSPSNPNFPYYGYNPYHHYYPQ